MNFRNKYLVITVRSIFGLAFVMLGIMGLFMGPPPDEMMSPAGLAAFQGMEALGILKLLAVTELVAGLLMLSGLYPALGNLLVAPIIVVINAYHIVKEPSTMIPGVIFLLICAYLGYAYWDKYRPLFVRS